MYLVVMLFNSIVISHVKLIDLIQADKKSEKIKLKNPILCVIIFIIACLILAVAYYQVGWNYNALTSSRVIACIIAGVIATILIFWSISGLLLRIFMSAKGVYFKNINSNYYFVGDTDKNYVKLNPKCCFRYQQLCLQNLLQILLVLYKKHF